MIQEQRGVGMLAAVEQVDAIGLDAGTFPERRSRPGSG